MERDIRKNIKEITFWRASLPMLALVMVNTLSAPINTFISSGVSKVGVEAIGTAGGIMMMFGVLLSLLSGGAGIIIGQYIGKKYEGDKLKKVVDTTFFVNLIQILFLVILMETLANEFIKWWGLKKGTETYDIAVKYIRYMSASLLLIGIGNYFLSTMSVYGHPKWNMIIGISTTLLDLSLSSIFVFATNIGVMGVVLGTVLSRIYTLTLSTILYSKYVQHVWLIRLFDWQSAKEIMRISIPIAGEKINYNAGQFLQGILIGQLAIIVGLNIYGHNYMLWSRAIFNSVSALVLVAGVAFGVGVEQVISRRFGEGKFVESKRIVWQAFAYAVLMDVLICTLIFVIHDYIIDWLTTQEGNKQAIAKLKDELYWSFVILFFLEIGRCANLIYVAACRSAGDSKFTAIASVPVTWATQLLLVWIFVYYCDMGWTGVALGAMLDECLRGLINYLRWKSNKWKYHLKKIHKNAIFS